MCADSPFPWHYQSSHIHRIADLFLAAIVRRSLYSRLTFTRHPRSMMCSAGLAASSEAVPSYPPWKRRTNQTRTPLSCSAVQPWGAVLRQQAGSEHGSDVGLVVCDADRQDSDVLYSATLHLIKIAKEKCLAESASQ